MIPKLADRLKERLAVDRAENERAAHLYRRQRGGPDQHEPLHRQRRLAAQRREGCALGCVGPRADGDDGVVGARVDVVVLP